jgi:hypothetical protein
MNGRDAKGTTMTTTTETMITVATEADFRKLSYYTLCRLAQTTHYAYPPVGLPTAIARGEFKGRLTLDSLGNFIRFE